MSMVSRSISPGRVCRLAIDPVAPHLLTFELLGRVGWPLALPLPLAAAIARQDPVGLDCGAMCKDAAFDAERSTRLPAHQTAQPFISRHPDDD
jgi:hypothetical protein